MKLRLLVWGAIVLGCCGACQSASEDARSFQEQFSNANALLGNGEDEPALNAFEALYRSMATTRDGVDIGTLLHVYTPTLRALVGLYESIGDYRNAYYTYAALTLISPSDEDYPHRARIQWNFPELTTMKTINIPVAKDRYETITIASDLYSGELETLTDRSMKTYIKKRARSKNGHRIVAFRFDPHANVASFTLTFKDMEGEVVCIATEEGRNFLSIRNDTLTYFVSSAPIFEVYYFGKKSVKLCEITPRRISR